MINVLVMSCTQLPNVNKYEYCIWIITLEFDLLDGACIYAIWIFITSHYKSNACHHRTTHTCTVLLDLCRSNDRLYLWCVSFLIATMWFSFQKNAIIHQAKSKFFFGNSRKEMALINTTRSSSVRWRGGTASCNSHDRASKLQISTTPPKAHKISNWCGRCKSSVNK